MAEIPALFAQRPIVLRHKKAALYHPFVEALALTLVDIPITFSTTVVFGVVLYFMVGLQRSAASNSPSVSFLSLTYGKQSQFLCVTTVLIQWFLMFNLSAYSCSFFLLLRWV
jgi:ATP-binding cassette subfamily G (WHITE) protein 2 (SNQ2)